MPAGTIIADFAGSLEEARAFAKANGFNQSNKLARNVNGDPQISISFTNYKQRDEALALFEKHGWDLDSVVIHLKTQKRK